MRNVLTIWRRELAACFLSPVAYVTLGLFPAVAGATFLVSVVRNVGTTIRLPALLFAAILVWLPFLATIVSMRIFSEEKRSGTLEVLMTAPVKDTQIVAGKYLGAYTFVLAVLAPTVGVIFFLKIMSPGIDRLDYGALAAGGFLVALIAAFWTSIGTVFSLLTKNQIVAALCSFTVIWLTILVGDMASVLPMTPSAVLDALSLTTHLDDFARGSVEAQPIVLYASGILFMLFSAVKVLEGRRWK